MRTWRAPPSARAIALLVLCGCARAGQETAVRIAPRTQLAALQANFSQRELALIDHHCPLGRPKLDPTFGFGPTRFVIRDGHVLQHSSRDKIPIWVCEGIAPQQLSGSLTRADAFKADSLLPVGERSELADYKGSGYDRGHMAPAADQTKDARLKRETFFLSNMSPQVPQLNQQLWKALESKVRDWLLARGGGYAITGSLFYDPAEEQPRTADGLIPFAEIGKGKVAVPTHFYKIVVAKDQAGRWQAIAFVMENKNYPRPFDFQSFEQPIDWIEERAGIDFMPDLNARDEPRVEGSVPALWTP
jgi:endonuclease G, mitochondrial